MHCPWRLFSVCALYLLEIGVRQHGLLASSFICSFRKTSFRPFRPFILHLLCHLAVGRLSLGGVGAACPSHCHYITLHRALSCRHGGDIGCACESLGLSSNPSSSHSAAWPWASHLPSQWLSFAFSTVRIVSVSASLGCCKTESSAKCKVNGADDLSIASFVPLLPQDRKARGHTIVPCFQMWYQRLTKEVFIQMQNSGSSRAGAGSHIILATLQSSSHCACDLNTNSSLCIFSVNEEPNLDFV